MKRRMAIKKALKKKENQEKDFRQSINLLKMN
jgi:hypothetical protein